MPHSLLSSCSALLCFCVASSHASERAMPAEHAMLLNKRIGGQEGIALLRGSLCEEKLLVSHSAVGVLYVLSALHFSHANHSQLGQPGRQRQAMVRSPMVA